MCFYYKPPFPQKAKISTQIFRKIFFSGSRSFLVNFKKSNHKNLLILFKVKIFHRKRQSKQPMTTPKPFASRETAIGFVIFFRFDEAK